MALSLRNKPIRRILLIRLRNIGDVLLTVPTLRAFREAFPRAFIAVLVNAGTEEMLTANPLLDEVLIFDPSWKDLPIGQRWEKEIGFIRKVRSRKFDMAVNLTEGDRGAILSWACGAPYKVGVYKKDHSFWWKKIIFSQWVRIPDWRAHMVEQILEIPRSLGLNPKDKTVEIFYSKKDEEIIVNLLQEAGVAPQDDLIHVHPTSRWLFKCWRDEGMAKVIDMLQRQGNARVILTSGKGEKELEKIGSIIKKCETKPIDLSGRTTLKQLAALDRRCKFFIGVDSAPMHIAAAVGTPVIALFGPSGEFNWGPWGEGHAVIKKDWQCRPCGQDGCQGSKRSRCLEEISEEEVIGKAFQFLARARNVAVEDPF